MKNSKNLACFWLKRSALIVVSLVILLILVGNYAIDYYAKALTSAGSWPITGTPVDMGLVYDDILG